MTQERITDNEWEKKVRPNLANLPTNMLIDLSRALSAKNFEKTKEILANALKPKEKKDEDQYDK